RAGNAAWRHQAILISCPPCLCVAGCFYRCAMHVLFIIDPLPSLKAYKDSSVAMMRALQARGHQLSVAYQPDLYIDEGTVKAVSQSIELTGADLHGASWWSNSGDAREMALAAYDAVVMRKDPPFDMEYV